jgi:hypothetical protein
MNFLVYYILGFVIPVIIGAILYVKSHEVCIQEVLISAGLALVTVGLTHFIVVKAAGYDKETWSGYAYETIHYPYWYAEWEEWVPPTYDENGNQTGGGYYETCWEHHREHWTVLCTVNGEPHISKKTHYDIRKEYGEPEAVVEKPRKPDFKRGDRNIYRYCNESRVTIPTNVVKSWDNPTRRSPNIMNLPTVSEEEATELGLFDYPDEHPSMFQSNRVLGDAAVHIRVWDEINARLGEALKINLILVKFDDISLAYKQESYWEGGKKNDVVICYGGSDNKPDWSYVFGWSDDKTIMKNIQTFVLDEGIDNNSAIGIEHLLRDSGYQIKDWDTLDYIKVQPKLGSLIWMLLVVIVTQGGLWFHFTTNNWN